jgi:hypothetical protein
MHPEDAARIDSVIPKRKSAVVLGISKAAASVGGRLYSVACDPLAETERDLRTSGTSQSGCLARADVENFLRRRLNPVPPAPAESLK